MASIADIWRANHTPRQYHETLQGNPLRVECPDYVLHRVMLSYACPKCNDRGWVLTEAGKQALKLILEWKAAEALFKDMGELE